MEEDSLRRPQRPGPWRAEAHFWNLPAAHPREPPDSPAMPQSPAGLCRHLAHALLVLCGGGWLAATEIPRCIVQKLWRMEFPCGKSRKKLEKTAPPKNTDLQLASSCVQAVCGLLTAQNIGAACARFEGPRLWALTSVTPWLTAPTAS